MGGPNLSHLTLGALVASHHIVIPVSAAVWSTTGLRKFVRWINVHQEDEVIDAQLLGLVGTIVPARTRIGKALLDELHSSEFPTFSTFIPRRIGAEDAVMDRSVAGELGADPALNEAYLALTKEVIERVTERQDLRGRRRA
jgi:chromosome partitioning protein